MWLEIIVILIFLTSDVDSSFWISSLWNLKSQFSARHITLLNDLNIIMEIDRASCFLKINTDWNRAQYKLLLIFSFRVL